MTLYFAYGSNLSKKQMRQRCPHSLPLRRAALQGWRWLIGERGYCTIVPSSRGKVQGALYALTPEDEAALDVSEGVANGAYQKIALTVTDADGNNVQALVYVDPRTSPGVPSSRYLRRCIAGAKAWQLPSRYVEKMETHPVREVVEFD